MVREPSQVAKPTFFPLSYPEMIKDSLFVDDHTLQKWQPFLLTLVNTLVYKTRNLPLGWRIRLVQTLAWLRLFRTRSRHVQAVNVPHQHDLL
jgi:hypothetical protein